MRPTRIMRLGIRFSIPILATPSSSHHSPGKYVFRCAIPPAECRNAGARDYLGRGFRRLTARAEQRTSKRIQRLTHQRNCRMDAYLHLVSRRIIEFMTLPGMESEIAIARCSCNGNQKPRNLAGFSAVFELVAFV